MVLLLPCKDEFAAHLLRSRLLSFDVHTAVVHDGAATLYGGWIMRPHLAIDMADMDLARTCLAESEEPIHEDTFVEPRETADLNEDLGLKRVLPPFGEMLVCGTGIGFVLGIVLLALVTGVRVNAEGEIPWHARCIFGLMLYAGPLGIFIGELLLVQQDLLRHLPWGLDELRTSLSAAMLAL